jgi:hypothetical protein
MLFFCEWRQEDTTTTHTVYKPPSIYLMFLVCKKHKHNINIMLRVAYHIAYHISCHVTSCHIMSYHITYHIISSLISSHSHHLISSLLISSHLISHLFSSHLISFLISSHLISSLISSLICISTCKYKPNTSIQLHTFKYNNQQCNQHKAFHTS